MLSFPGLASWQSCASHQRKCRKHFQGNLTCDPKKVALNVPSNMPCFPPFRLVLRENCSAPEDKKTPSLQHTEQTIRQCTRSSTFELPHYSGPILDPCLPTFLHSVQKALGLLGRCACPQLGTKRPPELHSLSVWISRRQRYNADNACLFRALRHCLQGQGRPRKAKATRQENLDYRIAQTDWTYQVPLKHFVHHT